MAFITSDQTQPGYDVVVVGSGAAGGQVVFTLAMAGVKVLMLEAGRNYDAARETPMFQANAHAPLRGAGTPDKPFGFFDATVNGGWEIPGEPYTNASNEPERKFQWWRSRMLGGRTNHWGRIALRYGPYDFKPYSRDGLGFDWPISYADLAPYYDKAEMLIGVFGSNDGLENTPDSSPGVLLPPPRLRAGEMLARQRGRKIGIPVIPVHRAVLSVRPDVARVSRELFPNDPRARRILAEAMRQRAACFWATSCLRGCSIGANYQSPTVQLPPALATGNLDILPNAMAREVSVDRAGKATGIVYIDKTTGQERSVRGQVVVLAASSAESVRLLLNSKSPSFPNGLANSSGRVGKGITDNVGANMHGQVPLLEDLPLHNEDGAGGDHVYFPWWLHPEQKAGKLDFPRGYNGYFMTGRQMPGVGTVPDLDWLTGGSYGRKLKDDARRYYGSTIAITGRGEMIPNENSYCEIDPQVKDRWGIPALRFHWKWSDYETRQAAHMQQAFADLITAMGGKVREKPMGDGRRAITPGGWTIHEVGGTMMGTDRRTSVTNQWGQTWDLKNLFVADGGIFPSNASKNPTLTILALAWRNSDYLLDELRKGNL